MTNEKELLLQIRLTIFNIIRLVFAKHCAKNVQMRSISGPYFPIFSTNTGKYEPEKTPYLDIFYAVTIVNI